MTLQLSFSRKEVIEFLEHSIEEASRQATATNPKIAPEPLQYYIKEVFVLQYALQAIQRLNEWPDGTPSEEDERLGLWLRMMSHDGNIHPADQKRLLQAAERLFPAGATDEA